MLIKNFYSIILNWIEVFFLEDKSDIKSVPKTSVKNKFEAWIQSLSDNEIADEIRIKFVVIRLQYLIACLISENEWISCYLLN